MADRTAYSVRKDRDPNKKSRKLGLLGKKLGMTQVFDAKGEMRGVTVIQLGPCLVVDKRTMERDGYTALQLGFDQGNPKRVNKAAEGHYKHAGGKDNVRRFIKELRVDPETLAKFEIGKEITVKDLGWQAGEWVDVSGVTKGKGFQGVVKRYGFKGFPATHGTHEYFRHGGSIGCRKWPGRIIKGRRMPGHMGDRNRTTQNIKIIGIREEDNALLVHGSIPGAEGSYVLVRPAIK